MTSKTFVRTAGLLAGLALSLSLALPPAYFAAPQQPAPAAAPQAGQRGGRGAIDPRVQQRTYKFTFGETNEDVPYAVFVSSKVSSAKKNPLIISLHGLGGSQNTMMTRNALELAEEGGYIYVGPMGYTPGGWYGAPSTMAAVGNVGLGGPRGGAPGGGRGGPGAAGPGAGRWPVWSWCAGCRWTRCRSTWGWARRRSRRWSAWRQHGAWHTQRR